MKVLSELETTWFVDLDNLVKYIGKIDVLQCKTYLAKTYKYCQPEIDYTYKNAYVSAYELRHCLIEHINQNESGRVGLVVG